MSWVHLDDVVELLVFVLEREELRGPVNVVAPAPVTNAELTAALGRALGRPALVPAPAFALRLALGEMADALLEGQRVHPDVAVAHGFRFRHPEIDGALTAMCRDGASELVREQWVPRAPSEVFAFFSDARNLERITPPFLKFRIANVSTPTLQAGTRIDYQLSLHGVPVRWQSLIRDWTPDRSFVDVQTRGPYRLWEHTHEFEPWRDGTIIRDRVRYELPLGTLGETVAGGFVGRDLEAIFAFRRATIQELFG
jgi:ligand-binding SRPBCC domain-containing protein